MSEPASVPAGISTVLITGGCGFIGCNLADALMTRGVRVQIIDAFVRAGSRKNAAWLRHRHGDRVNIKVADIRNTHAVNRLVSDVDAVLHLAAQVAVTASLVDPSEDLDINVRGTLNVLEAVRRFNPHIPVIFASTNKVYGPLFESAQLTRKDDRDEPTDPRKGCGIDEQTPLDLYSPYGCSKGVADQYVRDYARVFGLRTAVLRMSCIYGPHQFGTEDQGWIAHFLIRALRGLPITIYGTGYQVRDALFIDDAVEAWTQALGRIDEITGRIFNLGGGPDNSVSLREMINLIAKLHREKPEFRFAPARPGDQYWYVSNIRAISQALDWSPRVALRDGLETLQRWLIAYLDRRPARAEEARL